MTNDNLRRQRKVLLTDLSALVKTGKSLEIQRANTFTMESEPLANETVDDMLLKAFTIVTRGVKFLDAFLNDPRSEAITLRCAAVQALIAKEHFGNDPSTLPAAATSFENAPSGCDATSRRLSSRSNTGAATSAQTVESQTRRQSYRSHVYSPSLNSPTVRHSSMHLRRSSCLSQAPTAEAIPVNRANFFSERLTVAYNSLSDSLAALLSECHTGTCTEKLFQALRLVVHEGKDLCAIIEVLRDVEWSEESTFHQICEKMYECIDKLLQAARNCVVADENDDKLDTQEYSRITVSATDFVIVANKCATEARAVIDHIGDFSIPSTALNTDESQFVLDKEPRPNSSIGLGMVIDTPPQPDARPPPPPSAPSAEEEKPLPSFPVTKEVALQDIAMAQTFVGADEIVDSTSMQSTPVKEDVVAATATATAVGPIAEKKQALPLNQSIVYSPIVEQKQMLPLDQTIVYAPQNFNQSFNMSFSADTTPDTEMRSSSRQASQVSTLTTSTYMSRLRDSEYSVVSQTSTRATTPDLVPHTSGHQSTYSSSVNSLAESQATAQDIHETECTVLTKSYVGELVLDAEGQVTAGSLPALVERLTASDCKPDAKFVSAFHLTFRLFTTPVAFAEALIDRYDYVDDNGFIRQPVRLRICNVFKGWLESHWRHATDCEALPVIKSFAMDKLSKHFSTEGNRLKQLADAVATTDTPLVPRLISSMGKSCTSYVAADTAMPVSALTRKEINLLKAWKNGGHQNTPTALDLSPLELARQFTLIEMKIFNNIQPDELLACEWMKNGGSTAVNVRAMCQLSNGLIDLVKESILGREEIEPKKRAAIIKHWIKIGVECLALNNFNCLFSIYSALADSSINRLKKTWALVSEKRKQQFAEFHHIFDASHNKKNLRQKLAEHVPPCIPFMGLYQGDLHFYHIGNPDFKKFAGNDKQLINFGKHIKTAHVISEVQRFQIPYRFIEIPDLQAWISIQIARVRAVNDGMNEAEINTKYHQRSLAVEPRQTAPSAYASTTSVLPTSSVTSFGSSGSAPTSATATKDKFDIFSWKSSKEKLNPNVSQNASQEKVNQLTTTETNQSS